EADNGLTVSVKVEIEGNTHASPVDESQLTVSGEFGAITLGAEDGASVLTHHGVRDAGFGMLCGDFGSWINGIKGCGPGGMGTAGHGLGDKNNITYFSPRINGVHFGVTYIPNIGQEAQTAPLTDNDSDAWAIGGNYVGDFGGANVAFSLGHYERATNYTYSNIGLQVGMGAFSFDVAYAVSDDGADAGDNTDVVAAGAMYSDGPMAVSLSSTVAEADDGDDQWGTLLSASYTLAPGIAWRNSLFAAERDRGATDDDAGTTVEGNGFVTGITVSF
ncbi:MAG: porin, partial [Alphaproteobacteria bacterium]|nr:porin [Alphaproteobacteria bacterium]